MAYRSRARSTSRRRPVRRPAGYSARAVRRPARRGSRRPVTAGRGGTVRIVLQTGPAPVAPVMRDPLGGSQLVMPGAPRTRRARF